MKNEVELRISADDVERELQERLNKAFQKLGEFYDEESRKCRERRSQELYMTLSEFYRSSYIPHRDRVLWDFPSTVRPELRQILKEQNFNDKLCFGRTTRYLVQDLLTLIDLYKKKRCPCWLSEDHCEYYNKISSLIKNYLKKQWKHNDLKELLYAKVEDDDLEASLTAYNYIHRMSLINGTLKFTPLKLYVSEEELILNNYQYSCTKQGNIIWDTRDLLKVSDFIQDTIKKSESQEAKLVNFLYKSKIFLENIKIYPKNPYLYVNYIPISVAEELQELWKLKLQKTKPIKIEEDYDITEEYEVSVPVEPLVNKKVPFSTIFKNLFKKKKKREEDYDIIQF